MKKYLKIIFSVGLVCLGLFALGATFGLYSMPFAMAGSLAAAPLITGFNFSATDEQTGMVIAYKNPSLIADSVMPRTLPLKAGKLEFTYFERSLKNGFTVPDTMVSRKGRPNSIDLEGEKKTGSVIAHGLENTLPVEDIENADDGGQLVTQEMQALIDLVLLGREARVAAIVQKSSNYDTNCVVTQTGTDRFDNDSFDAFKAVMKQLDKSILRPNVIGMSGPAWTAFRMNPFVVKATNKNSGDAGAAARAAVAELLEVDEILVGQSRINTANRGKDPVLSMCWGNYLWGHYRSKTATLKDGVTWGLSAVSGTRYTKVEEDSKVGLKGGYRIVVGEYINEVVIAKPAGILMQGVVTPA